MTSSRPALDVLVEAKKKKCYFLKDCDGNHMTIVPQSCDDTAGARLEVMITKCFLSLTFFYLFIYFTIRVKLKAILCYNEL